MTKFIIEDIDWQCPPVRHLAHAGIEDTAEEEAGEEAVILGILCWGDHVDDRLLTADILQINIGAGSQRCNIAVGEAPQRGNGVENKALYPPPCRGEPLWIRISAICSISISLRASVNGLKRLERSKFSGSITTTL